MREDKQSLWAQKVEGIFNIQNFYQSEMHVFMTKGESGETLWYPDH